MPAKKILMVCMGNICRSPMAEGILRDMVRKQGLDIRTDSAGTIDSHAGEAPDKRAQACMRDHGLDISDLRARQIRTSDLTDFDLLLAMDEDNLDGLLSIAPDPTLAQKAKLLMDYAPEHSFREVPDPYYGGPTDFEEVFGMVSIACERLLHKLDHG